MWLVLRSRIKEMIKATVRSGLPLGARKQLAIWLRMSGRTNWSAPIVRDLARNDVNSYHRFLWSNHLGYAESYGVKDRFGAENIEPSRHILIYELKAILPRCGLTVENVHSAFDVGCSMGYLLRHLETEVFTNATELGGNDIDEYAVKTGSSHLRGQGSRVLLHCVDMSNLNQLLGAKSFDVMLCAGVLMYLKEGDAKDVVRAMLAHTRGIVAIAGLAHPELDNALLSGSATREHDATFIHNIDAMVIEAGGEILHRRWDGAEMVGGNTIYFIFAAGMASQPTDPVVSKGDA